MGDTTINNSNFETSVYAPSPGGWSVEDTPAYKYCKESAPLAVRQAFQESKCITDRCGKRICHFIKAEDAYNCSQRIDKLLNKESHFSEERKEFVNLFGVGRRCCIIHHRAHRAH